MGSSFIGLLEADLRNLSAEARKSEAGFAGYFTGSQHPEVKEAAERGLLKLRSLEPEVADAYHISLCEEILNAFLLACKAKNVRLSAIGLASIQKLIANDAAAKAAIPEILACLRHHAEVYDEAVQLKTLQTILTLLQSKLYPEEEEQVAMMLGICFRLLGSTQCADSVHTTAAATLRQAVALIFDRIVATEGLDDGGKAARNLRLPDSDVDGAKPHSGATKAGLLLFSDLCALATGQSGPWLQVPPLPKAFALDMLEFVLSHHAVVFTQLQNFERLLGGRLATLLMTSLRASGGYEDEGAEIVERRLLMRTVSTVVKQFGHVLITECEIYLTVLVKSLEQDFPLWHRIFVLEVLRTICGDAELIRFLFQTYDKSSDTTSVVKDLVIVLARHVHSALQVEGADEILANMSMLFNQKAQGAEWSPDMEMLLNGGPVPEAFAVSIATDGLLAIVDVLGKLADKYSLLSAKARAEAEEAQKIADKVANIGALQALSLENGSADGGAPPAVSDAGAEDAEAARVLEIQASEMVTSLWEVLLLPMSMLLSRCSGEALVLELLKGYQTFTETCGTIGVDDARDAFLASLCDFTLSQRADNKPAPTHTHSDSAAGSAPGANGLDRSMSGSGNGALVEAGKAGGTPGGGKPGGMGAGEPRGEGLILAPKNVHALRTLFNIAHRLSGNLGPSWVLVLETLSQLERALNSPHTTTQEEGGAGADLSILSTAAAQLFQSTVMLDHNAVNSLLAALRDVSAKAARSMVGGGQGMGLGQPPARLFALSRLVDVVLHNVNRMRDLWPTMEEHLMEIVNHENLQVRVAALEALERAVCGGLAVCHRVPAAAPPSPVDPATATTTMPQAEARPFELIVLEPLEALAVAPHDDVRQGCLRIINHALQRSGESLTIGWRAVIVLLTKAATGPEKSPAQTAIVATAFQSAQLLAQDYLGSIPEDTLNECVRMAAAFGAQNSDLNISLTAIGLMWNMADFFGRSINALLREKDAGAEGGEGGDGAGAEGDMQVAPRGGEGGSVEKAGLIAELLLLPLFGALKELCSDGRPEVRNSGLRTLLSTLVSHGGKLPPSLWKRCLWEILFPLLDTVRSLAASSSREESVGTQLGKEKGRAVMMLIHHSRNTEQKQWDETLVLSLNGVGRLLRTYLTVLVTLDGFDARWDSFLAFFESSVAEGSREVAVAAIGSLTSILQGHAGTTGLPRPLWKRAIRAYVAAVRGASKPGSRVGIKTRVELISALTKLYIARRAAFDEADMRALLALLDALARCPFAEGEQPSAVMLQAMGLPPTQQAVLEFVAVLAPFDDRHVRAGLWGALFHMLLAYLPGEGAAPPADGAPVGGAGAGQPALPAPEGGSVALALANGAGPGTLSHGPGAQAHIFQEPCPITGERVETMPGALSPAFAENVTKCLVGLYKEHTPSETRALLFMPILAGLQKCLASRATAPDSQLWRAASHALVVVTRTGIPAVNLHSTATAAAQVRDDAIGALVGRPDGVPSAVDRKGKGGMSNPYEIWGQVATAFETLLLPGAAVHEAGTHLRTTPEQRHADEELELAALDTLCDVTLAACAAAPDHLRQRLVRIVDCGVDRPIPPEGYSGGERFSHVCLRKLFVLCSRGGEAEGPHACTLGIARHALPILINRCQTIMAEYAEADSPTTTVAIPRSKVEEMMCVMEVLETMTLDSRVSNWMAEGNDDFPGHPGIANALQNRRQLEEFKGARERAHLLFVYPTIIQCIASKDAKIREQVGKLLLLAGRELAIVSEKVLEKEMPKPKGAEAL